MKYVLLPSGAQGPSLPSHILKHKLSKERVMIRGFIMCISYAQKILSVGVYMLCTHTSLLTNNIASHLGTLDYGDSLDRSRQEERYLSQSKHDVDTIDKCDDILMQFRVT